MKHHIPSGIEISRQPVYEARCYNASDKGSWISLLKPATEEHTGLIVKSKDEPFFSGKKPSFDMIRLQFGDYFNRRKTLIRINGKEYLLTRFFDPYQFQSSIIDITGPVDCNQPFEIFLPYSQYSVHLTVFSNTDPEMKFIREHDDKQLCVNVMNTNPHSSIKVDLLDFETNEKNPDIKYYFRDNGPFNTLIVDGDYKGEQIILQNTGTTAGMQLLIHKNPYQFTSDRIEIDIHPVQTLAKCEIEQMPGTETLYYFCNK